MDYIQKIIVTRWKHVQLDKAVELQPGINLILGKNGSGKTSLIGMVEAAAVSQTQSFNPTLDAAIADGTRVASIELNSGGVAITTDNNRRGNEGQWTVNDLKDRVRSIGSSRTVTSGTNTKNPFASSLGLDTSVSGVGQTIDVAEEFNKSIIKELIDVIKEKIAQGADFLEDLQKDYQNGLVDFDKTLKIDPSKENAVFFIDHLNREVPIANLSSGEKEYLYFYAYLRRIRADENKVILIDEPELHLHSSQIRKLCELIAALAVKNQVIIATHSGEVLQHFISRSNIILLSKGIVHRIQDAEEMRKALEETGLPIDPSVFTAHWVCAENDPTLSLHGGGPTTPEVLGWILGNELQKRYWSFGSNKATSKIYGEGIASALPATHKIRVTPLLDGDVLVKTPADYFPAVVPVPVNDLAYFPFWEIENAFLSESILNAVIPLDGVTTGSERFWAAIAGDQARLLLCVKKTVAKNSLRRFSLDKYINADPQADIEKWKTEIQASATDLAPIDARFAEVVTSKNWRWLPGKEALALAISIEPNFWAKLRELQQNKQLKTLLEADAGMKAFIESISALSGDVAVAV